MSDVVGAKANRKLCCRPAGMGSGETSGDLISLSERHKIFKSFTVERFVREWNRGRLREQPVYFASWRIAYQLLRSGQCTFGTADYEHFMASITSHYNIGGGLDPQRAIKSGREPKEVFEKAVETLRQFKVTTANSLILLRLLSPHLDNLIYAPNGVDADYFFPSPTKIYNPANIRIGWVGKIKAAKKYSALLEARAQLDGKGFSFHVAAYPKRVRKRELLSSKEIRNFYRGTDYYLCTSWHEGTPNPALEAAACGVPVVTTRVGNMPELIDHNVNGFFVEPKVDSIVVWLREIQNLEFLDYQVLATNIRERILRDWTWERNVKNYRMAFSRLLGGRIS